MKKLKLIALSLSVLVLGVLTVGALTTTPLYATTLDIQGSMCEGSDLSAIGSSDCEAITSTAGADVNSKIALVINIFSWIVGVVCVIMIIYGGFKYVVAGGDTTKVGEAKNTILYALIGLVIVALAQIIVKFVLNKVTTPSAP